ncbi:MAG: hypothetical protein JXB48_20130 [Candidatus Latescibacteria bacterium]|nr:hypothetical protein [Candidatus Latescibacterota bacterium]
MKTKYVLTTLLFIIIFSVTGTGQNLYDDLNIKAKMDEEPLDYTLNRRFSSQEAYFRLGQLRKFIKSCVSLMKENPQGILEKEVKIKEMSLDFEIVNWSNCLEGTIKKQEYLIAKLQYELARERYEAGKIGKEVFDSQENKYIQAKDDFETFFNSFQIVD